jgi:hypothetical protein
MNLIDCINFLEAQRMPAKVAVNGCVAKMVGCGSSIFSSSQSSGN